MAITLPDSRSLPNATLEDLRLRALHACEAGFTETDIALILGVRRETVCQWWTAYRHGGLDALPQGRTGRPVGSRRLLADTQAQPIRDFLDAHRPPDLGIAAPLWNRRAVAALVQKELGITLALRTVGSYLRRWGYTPQRPARQARRQVPQEVEQWLQQDYPRLATKAQAEGADIYWCDEMGWASTPSRGGATPRRATHRPKRSPASGRVSTRSRRSITGAKRTS